MTDGRRVQSFPMIERITPGSGGEFVPVSVHTDSQGAVDVSGLAPGQYEIRMQGPGREINPAIVEVAAGAVQTLDMSEPSTIASVSIHIDGISEEEARSVHISLIDPETGRNVARSGRSAYVFSGALLRRQEENVNDNVVEVLPGRYRVVLDNEPNLYLSGITAQSAQVTGRFVTVPRGNSALTLHVAEGRADLSGVATIQGKPSVGAMILLVPTTLGDPAGLTLFVATKLTQTAASISTMCCRANTF